MTITEDYFQDFIDYCWDFYGPNGIHGDFFDHKLTFEQLTLAIQLRRATASDFSADSIDREAVREILLFCRDSKSLAIKAMVG